MKDLYTGQLAPHLQNARVSFPDAIASDPGKAVVAMPCAFTQIVVDTVERHPVLAVLVVLVALWLVLSPDLRRWSAEWREWSADRRRRRLEDRITSEEQVIRALEIDALRERRAPDDRQDDHNGQPPKSPP